MSCKHKNMRYSWTFTKCNDCGQFTTDSGADWGIARNKTFKSAGEAHFYREHGRLPEEIKND